MEKDYIEIIKKLISEIETKIVHTDNWIYYFYDKPKIQRYLMGDNTYEPTLKVTELHNDFIVVNVDLGYECLHNLIIELKDFRSVIENNVEDNDSVSKDIVG